MLSKELTQPEIFQWNTVAKVQVNLHFFPCFKMRLYSQK